MHNAANRRHRSVWSARWAAMVPVLIAALVAPPAASEVGIHFQRIADSDTFFPEGGIFFPPSLSAGSVAFTAVDFVGASGVYLQLPDQPLETVVDTTMAIPGGVENFLIFPGSPALDGGQVAFRGRDGLGFDGIYLYDGESLAVVANKATVDASGSGTLSTPADPTLSMGHVAFRAFGTLSVVGVYTGDADGVTAQVVDGDPVPGAEDDFTMLGPRPGLDGAALFFQGRGVSGADGIFRQQGGNTSPVADTDTLAPGTLNPFIGFGQSVSARGGGVAFHALDSDNKDGVYVEAGGLLTTAARAGDSVPGSDAAFVGFEEVSVDGGDVAFLGFGVYGPQGIYLRRSGELMKIVDENDSLDGHSIFSVELGLDALDDDQLAFTAHFDDQSSALYIATVPEPTPMLQLAAACLTIAVLARRQAKNRATGLP